MVLLDIFGRIFVYGVGVFAVVALVIMAKDFHRNAMARVRAYEAKLEAENRK